jgi:hypothetical protein
MIRSKRSRWRRGPADSDPDRRLSLDSVDAEGALADQVDDALREQTPDIDPVLARFARQRWSGLCAAVASYPSAVAILDAVAAGATIKADVMECAILSDGEYRAGYARSARVSAELVRLDEPRSTEEGYVTMPRDRKDHPEDRTRLWAVRDRDAVDALQALHELLAEEEHDAGLTDEDQQWLSEQHAQMRAKIAAGKRRYTPRDPGSLAVEGRR